MDVGRRDEDKAKGRMIGIFRWGYGGGFEAIAFWGWVEEGLERGGLVHSIVAGRRACLIAHDMEMRREVLRTGAVKSVSAPIIRSAATSGIEKSTIRHERRKAAFSQAESVFKAEGHHPVQKNIAQVSRSEVADTKTARAVAESGTTTKTVKR